MESSFLFLLCFTEKGNEGNFCGDGNSLYLDLVIDGRFTLYTYVNIHTHVIYMCPILHLEQFPIPILENNWEIVFFENCRTEDLWTLGHQAHMRERCHTKIWGIQ